MTGRGCRALSAMLLLVAATDAIGQASPKISETQLRFVDSLVAKEFAKDSIGSITVGIVAGSQLAWTRSYGFADIKARRPANRNTVYRIASITKPFTAVMLMQLVEAGKVRLSDPVERFLPEVRQIRAAPPGARPFTFLQLATMTSGLAREPDEAGRFWKGPFKDWEKQLLAALPRTSYASVPGTEYLYSNIGYAILGSALARAAGEPYVDWQRTKLLAPLDMRRTRFEIDSTIARDLAVGYDVNDDGTIDDTTAAKEIREGRGYKIPNGAIFTTVDDLARFVAFELGRVPSSVLPRAVLDDAFEGLVATGPLLDRGYGLGFMAMRPDDPGSLAYVGHSGNFVGYNASMWFHRQMQLGVVLFRNVTGGKQEPDRLAVDILQSLIKERQAAIQADINERFKAQKASPGSEAALRRLIGFLRAGKPEYDAMGPALARSVRRGLAEEQATLSALGALMSLTFTRVGAAGPNFYEARFEKGAQEWRIWLNPEGNVDFFTHRRIALPRDSVRLKAQDDMTFDLRRLIPFQEAYFTNTRRYRYSTSIAELQALDRKHRFRPGVAITIDTATKSGWTAHATHRAAPGLICRFQIGGAVTAPEGAVTCSFFELAPGDKRLLDSLATRRP